MLTLVLGVFTAIMLAISAWTMYTNKAKNKIGIAVLLTIMVFVPFLFFSSYSIKLGQLL